MRLLVCSGCSSVSQHHTHCPSQASLPRLFDIHSEICAAYDASADGLVASIDGPLNDLTASIPHAGGSPIASLPVTRALRTAIDDLEAQKGQRDELLYAIATLDGTTLTISFEKTADNVAGVTLKSTDHGCVGVEVLSLRAGAPCEGAGLLVGDTVLKINGEAVATHAEATQRIIDSPRAVSLVVHRKGGAEQQALINAIVYRGEHTVDEILAAHLSKYARLQADVSKVIADHDGLLAAVRRANDAFTAARISETELQAKQRTALAQVAGESPIDNTVRDLELHATRGEAALWCDREWAAVAGAAEHNVRGRVSDPAGGHPHQAPHDPTHGTQAGQGARPRGLEP